VLPVVPVAYNMHPSQKEGVLVVAVVEEVVTDLNFLIPFIIYVYMIYINSIYK
jgi:hypothetical protein